MNEEQTKKVSKSKAHKDFSSDFSRSIFYCSRHNSQGGDVTAKLDRTEVRHDSISGKPFTVFCVTVKTCCSTWTVYKRYSEFVDLHKDLTKEHEDHINQSQTSTTTQGIELAKINLPRLPPKKLIGSSLEADFVNSRRIGLQTYIRQLIRDPLLFSSKTLSAFLQGKRYDAVGAIIEQYVDLKQRFHGVVSYVKRLETHIRRHEHRSISKQDQLMKEIRALGTRIAELESLNGIVPKATNLITETVAESAAREPLIETPPMTQWLTPQTQRSFSAQAALINSAPHSSSSSSSGWRSGWRLGAPPGAEDPYSKDIWGWDGSSTMSAGSGDTSRRSVSSKVVRGMKIRGPNDRTTRSFSESNLTEMNDDALAHKHYNYRTISDQRVSPFPAPSKQQGKYGEIGGHTASTKKDSGIHNPFGIGLNKNFYRRFMFSGGPSDSLILKGGLGGLGGIGLGLGPIGSKDDDTKGNRYGRSVSDQYGLSSSPDVGLGLLTGLVLEKKKENKARHDSEDSASSMNKGNKSEIESEEGGGGRPLSSIDTSQILLPTSSSSSSDIPSSVVNQLLSPPSKQVQFEITPPDSESILASSLVDSSPMLADTSSHSLSTSQSMEHLALPSLQLPVQSSTHATNNFTTENDPSTQPTSDTSISVFPARSEPQDIPSSTSASHKTIQFSQARTQSPHSPTLTSLEESSKRPRENSENSNGNSNNNLNNDTGFSPLSTGMLSPLHSSTSLGDLRALREFYEPYLFDPELNGRVDDIIKFVQPSESSETQFQLVLNFVRNLVNKTIGADVYAHGSYALKTYLPDADLDVSAFFSKGHENTWVQRIVQALCQEANTRASDPNLAVRSVTFVNADCKVVKAQIGRVSVDISGNQVAGLSSLGLFEEVDRLVGKDHLFKRTVLLAKTWAQNEAGILGSHKGLISSVCLRAMLLFLFNAYHQQLQTPLQAFYYMLIYLESFNWEEDALELFGPLKLSALPSIDRVIDGPTAWPEGCTPLLSSELIQRYSLARAKKKGAPGAYYSAQRRYLNVIDPADPENNLGKTVDYKHAQRIRAAFSEGASRLRATLFEWARVKSTHLPRSHSESEEDSDRGMMGGSRNYDRVEQTAAYRLVSTLFEQTLQAYGGRMPYRFHYKDRTRLTLYPPQPQSASIQTPGGHSIQRDISRESNDIKSPSTNTSTMEPLSPLEPPSPFLEDEDRKHKSGSQSASTSSYTDKKIKDETKNSILDTDLPEVLTQLSHARQFEIPDIGDTELVRLITEVLTKHGSVPVGKMGSLLHNLVNNHSLPSMLKEKYGGLKKFLERHEPVFVLGADHPFNPHVFLRAQLSPEQLIAVTTPSNSSPHKSSATQTNSSRPSRSSSRRSSTSSTNSRMSNLSAYPPLSSSTASNSGTGLVSPTRSLSRQQRPGSAWVNVARGVSPLPQSEGGGSLPLSTSDTSPNRSNTTSPIPPSSYYQDSRTSPAGTWGPERAKSPPNARKTPTKNRRRSVPASPEFNGQSGTDNGSSVWKKTRSKRSSERSKDREKPTSPKMKSKVRSPGKKSPYGEMSFDSDSSSSSSRQRQSRSNNNNNNNNSVEPEGGTMTRSRVTSSHRPYG